MVPCQVHIGPVDPIEEPRKVPFGLPRNGGDDTFRVGEGDPLSDLDAFPQANKSRQLLPPSPVGGWEE